MQTESECGEGENNWKSPEFYLMKLLSHFVLPGAHRIETSGGKDHLAFINPDNQIVLLLANTDTIEKKVNIRVNDKLIRVSVKGKSFNSLVWKQSQTKN